MAIGTVLRTKLLDGAQHLPRVALKLQAHGSRNRAQMLATVIPADGVGAELGVFKGGLSVLLLRQLRPRHLYLVDPWWELSPTWEWAEGNQSTVTAVREILRALRRPLEAGTASLVVADDREFLRSLPDGALDWVYIDSSHQYQHTAEELALLLTKVRIGGVVAGDDWHDDEAHPHAGVTKAVREVIDTGRLEHLFSDDASMQWATRVRPGPSA